MQFPVCYNTNDLEWTSMVSDILMKMEDFQLAKDYPFLYMSDASLENDCGSDFMIPIEDIVKAS